MKKLVLILCIILAAKLSQAQISCGTILATPTSGNIISFALTSLPPGTVLSYAWTFGDGGTAATANPSHTYANSGWYNVCVTLIVANAGTTSTCYSCDSIQVQNPIGPCQADFSYVTTSSGAIAFTGYGIGPGTITGWFWTFGDGGTSTQQNPIHVYANPGTYTPCLTISGVDPNNSPFSCTYCDSVVIGSSSFCNALFSYNTSGLYVYLTNMSTASGTITGYNWTFGDGGTSTQASPTHLYAQSGLYNVCLTINGINQNNTAFSCTYCDSMYVQSAGCNASFTQNQTSAATFSFTNTSTAPGTITGYAWMFGDGGTSTQMNPAHTYTSGGFYNVCLTINGIDPNNVPFTCTSCTTIYVQSSTACNASFTSQQVGSTYSFFNTSSAPGPITAYAWTFGDGGTSNVPNPVHTYALPGYYTVCLTISGVDSMNNSFVCSYCDTSIFVPGGNACQINANFTNTSSGNTANFTNTTTCTGCTSMSYSWNFGDVTTSTQSNPSHTYNAAGTYLVCLTVTGYVNGAICLDTICHTVTLGLSSVNNLSTSKNELTVYPNPVQETFTIHLPESTSYNFKIMDMTGKLIRSEKVSGANKTLTVNSSSFSQGIYHLILSDGLKTYHANILKQ